MDESSKKSDILKYALLSIWTMILVYIFEMAGALIGGIICIKLGENCSSTMQFALVYAGLLPIWIIIILFAHFRKADRPAIAKLKPKKEKLLFSIGMGLAIGLGLPNSGMVSAYSIFHLDLATASDSIFYNAAFGMEGTVMADILVLLACSFVFYFGRKKKANQE